MKRAGYKPCTQAIRTKTDPMDPIESIQNDRTEARKVHDPNADTCFLALASQQGSASIRTLVLRDIVENRFSIFMNQSSPKWQLLSDKAGYELLLWYPSQQRQYRISGEHQIMDQDEVETNWYRRPHGAKLLDYLYSAVAAQSSVIGSRQSLENEVARIGELQPENDMAPPNGVTGIELLANRIDMLDLNRQDRLHDRRLFTRESNSNDQKWQVQVMVP